MNPLIDIIPASWRRYLYAALALAVLVATCCQIAGVNIGKSLEVLAYIGAGLGAVAASNTPARD